MVNSQLNQIDERTSECGYKEDLDRKKFMYEEQIVTLKNRIKDIKMISQLTQDEVDNIRR